MKRFENHGNTVLMLIGWGGFVTAALGGRVFEVGPGKPFANIGDVPLETITAGDTVLIHWRAEPYREKWVIAAQGTADQPVVFRGVAGPAGQLPVIDGENAVTRRQLDYWNEPRSVIKIGGASTPSSTPRPEYITVENLDIRGGRPPAMFTDDAGNTQAYDSNAAAVHIEIAHHITIRNCILRECGNGLFVTSAADEPSRDLLIEGNHIHSSGNAGGMYEHNVYTEALGITYQFNHFGPPAPESKGNNLKDRSAGLVVRYNWIEGGNRQLDLVDATADSVIQTDPSYRKTFVYGNILVERDDAENRQIVHYGGDSGTTDKYRKGKLYFYHNTVVSYRAGRTTLVRLSTMEEQCDARNNIFFVTGAASNLSMLEADGVMDLSRNWIKPGWVNYFGSYSGVVNDDGTQIQTSDPGFLDFAKQDFSLAPQSVCIDAAGALHPDTAGYPMEFQYVPHQESRPWIITGSGPDIGALQRCLPDHNDDKVVNLKDFTFLSRRWLASGCNELNAWCMQTDLDRSGTTDLADLADWNACWLGRF